MKKNLALTALTLFVLLFSACEKENSNLDTTLYDEEISLISDEILTDLNFADLLIESEDGTYFYQYLVDNSTQMNKRATCDERTFSIENNRIVFTRDFSDGSCEKSGIIVVEYFIPETEDELTLTKTISYFDFMMNNVTYNGTITLERTVESYNIEAQIEIDRINDAGEAVHIAANYTRQFDWICGFGAQEDSDIESFDDSYLEDNIISITGSGTVTKTVNGEESSYSRTITSPLLVVASCDLKIQAGEFVINKADGTELEINYGVMPEDLNCEVDFDCNNTFEVTKNGKTYPIELVDGYKIQVTQE